MAKSYFSCYILTMLLSLGAAYGQVDGAARILGRYKVESIEFVGTRTYKDGRLVPLLSFEKGDYADAVLVDFGREDVEKFYLKKGFAFVEVTFDADKLAEGKVVYTVSEGRRVRVKKVMFEGNSALKSDKLKQAVKSDDKKWIFWSGYYSRQKVQADEDKLTDVYQNRGFLDYRVTSREEFSADRSAVRVTFEIDEGPVYVVRSVKLSGAEKIYQLGLDVDEQALQSRLKLSGGQVYRKRTVESDRRRLLELYRESGFIDASVKPDFYRVLGAGGVVEGGEFSSRAAVDVEFAILEGEQFRIGRIDVTGNRQTQEKVIRRVLDEYGFQPGRLYNAEVARGDGSGALEERIRRMAYTEEATITALPGYERGQKNAEVHVRDGRTGMWILGAGIGSDSGFIGQVILDQKNFDISDWPEDFGDFIRGESFKGAGQSLKVALQPGTTVSEYLVSFNEPYFQGKPISQDVIGSSWQRARESYDEGRLKGYLGFSERYDKRYRGNWRKSIGFRVENVEVDDLDANAPAEISEVEGDNLLVGIKFGVGKDFTDDPFVPTTGHKYKFSYEQVTGEDTFGILSGTYRLYHTLYEDLAERKIVLSTRLHGGVVVADAPPFEKFYAGGMYSIRGFDYRGVSTRGLQTNVADPQRKDPIGSDWLFLASEELTVPLVGESLSALFFIDSGTIDSGSFRVSAGGGIQILIPHWFGPVPMRFGIGVPLLKDDADERQSFFFSVAGLF